jgi:hypothetical protein
MSSYSNEEGLIISYCLVCPSIVSTPLNIRTYKGVSMIKKALAVFAILLTVSAQAQSRICANKTTGNILIRSTCFSSENTITNIANLKGPKGDTGLQGLRGLTGAQGTQGVKGDTGLQGIQGIKGDTGEQGLKGDQGEPADLTQCRQIKGGVEVTNQFFLAGIINSLPNNPTVPASRAFELRCQAGEFLFSYTATSPTTPVWMYKEHRFNDDPNGLIEWVDFIVDSYPGLDISHVALVSVCCPLSQ